jgi:pyruvate dehydrogenase E1 component alpha subunit
MSAESRLELYRILSLLRRADEKIAEVYASDVMQTPVHLSIGQESVAVAMCAHLRPDDLKIGTHRSHALYLANGGDLVGFFAELLGRERGCARGFGGSMHLIDRARGLVGTTSLVGGALPIAVGLAMSVARPRLAAVLFGDAAADEGVFAESLNFAQLKCLPVFFVCENNRYSVYTPEEQRRAVRPSAVARAFGVTTLDFPIEVANDVFALHDLLREPVAAVRQGGGPLMVECQTVRRFDHNGIRDDIAAGFRPQCEADLFEAYCPIKLARRALDTRIADAIDTEVRSRVDAAYHEALQAPETQLTFEHSGGHAHAIPRSSSAHSASENLP